MGLAARSGQANAQLKRAALIRGSDDEAIDPTLLQYPNNWKHNFREPVMGPSKTGRSPVTILSGTCY
jgi:hypothetical protein